MSLFGSIENEAFMNQTKLLSVVFGSKCWCVGDSAFKSCTSLSEINNDNVIEGIGDYAFAETNLSSISFNILNSVLNGVFLNCSNLRQISIPNCKSIHDNAFENCGNLQSVYSPNCTTVGKSAFNNCVSLKNFSFKNIINISDNAFYSCSSLDKIVLNICKSIGAEAFKGCSKLSQLTIPSTCSYIGSSAFNNCSNLSKVYINNIGSSICQLANKNVFCECSSSTSICLNKNITFFIKPDVFNLYKTEKNWEHYASNMVMLPYSYQIIYETTNKKIIEVNTDNVKNLETNTYNDSYGTLVFKSDITSLNINYIFEGSDISELLTSVITPYECKTIETESFANCKKLNNISLSDGLEYIYDYAFKNCISLTSFEIPDNIIFLGDGVFSGCEKIEKIEGKYTTYDNKAVVYNKRLICVLPNTESRIKISNIDSTITDLGKSCFNGCINLKRVDIPSNIKSIGNNAFENCTNLYEVHFEGTEPPTLGENVFNNVRGDFKIFVPEESFEDYCIKWSGYEDYIYPKPTDTQIIYYASKKIKDTHVSRSYTEYTNGTYYIVNNSRTVLTDNQFTGSNFTKVILGDNIKGIGMHTFKDCYQLEYIYIPFNINYFGEFCFFNCEKLLKICMPCNQNIKYGYNMFKRCLSLNEFIAYDKKYVSDDDRCFIKDNKLMFFAQGGMNGEYRIPENIITICDSAFKYANIQSIILSKRTKTIDVYAFANCENLVSITGWDNVGTISDGAFENCKNLGEITLPSKLNTIGAYAFNGCTNFKCVDKDGNPTELNLTKINMNASINEHTFCNCASLTNVVIGSKTKSIDEHAFENCTGLTSVSISNVSMLTSINKNAFKGCKNLTTLTLPKSLLTIGDSAFENCVKYSGGSEIGSEQIPILDLNPDIQYPDKEINLKAFEIPTYVSSIGAACFKNTGIVTLSMLNNTKLTKIPNGAFENCEKLSTVIISNDYITHIEDNAFCGCDKMLSITLPSKLKYLGNKSFYSANRIMFTVNIPESLTTPPDFSNDSRPFNTEGLFISAPKSLGSTYITHTDWKVYKDYIHIDEGKLEDYINEINYYRTENNLQISLNKSDNIPSTWIGETVYFKITNIDKTYNFKLSSSKTYNCTVEEDDLFPPNGVVIMSPTFTITSAGNIVKYNGKSININIQIKI